MDFLKALGFLSMDAHASYALLGDYYFIVSNEENFAVAYGLKSDILKTRPMVVYFDKEQKKNLIQFIKKLSSADPLWFDERVEAHFSEVEWNHKVGQFDDQLEEAVIDEIYEAISDVSRDKHPPKKEVKTTQKAPKSSEEKQPLVELSTHKPKEDTYLKVYQSDRLTKEKTTNLSSDDLLERMRNIQFLGPKYEEMEDVDEMVESTTPPLNKKTIQNPHTITPDMLQENQVKITIKKKKKKRSK